MNCNDLTRDDPDGTHIATITIPGRVYSKKTSPRIIRKRVLPSKNFCDYQARCGPCLLEQWAGRPALDFGVAVSLRVWVPSWASLQDHCGVMQSLGDILQDYGVVTNDRWIVFLQAEHWIQGADAANPRVEITISRFRHPREK